MFTTRYTILDKINLGCQVAWHDFAAIYRPLIILRGRDRGLANHEIDDLIQQVLLSVYNSGGASNYDPAKGRFRDWLRTIIDRRSYDILRKRRDAASLDHLQEFNVVPASDDHLRAEQAWEQEWQRFILAQAIEAVRPDVNEGTYEAFRLTVIEGLAPEEAATRLGVSANSVYVAKHRFLKRLKPVIKQLEEQGL